MLRWALATCCVAAVVVAAAALIERAAARRDGERFGPPGERVDIGGRRLHRVCAGHGSPAVWFEAGGTGCSTEYQDLQAALAATTRTCAYGRAGMGWSDDAPHDLDAGSLTDDLAALLAASGEDGPVVLVAGSAGGLTAELFARRHPDRVAGLMLIDALHSDVLAAPSMASGAGSLWRRAFAARALASVGLLRWVDPYHLGRLPADRSEREMALKYHARPWGAVLRLLGSGDASRAALAAAPPLRDDLPLIVVTHDPEAGADITIPEAEWGDAQARLAARSRRGRVVTVPGAGHHPEIDAPERVAALLRALVEEVRGSPG